ncbi:hypothetical protein SK128_008866 [Halocaridina rubra]|uniref:VWFA domain-containing protein n=1 Tax=Halocaridina rubra TaxID=373956 RepID=A0AAN8WX22_HALRR
MGCVRRIRYPNDKIYPTYYYDTVIDSNGKPQLDLRPTTCTEKIPMGSWIHRMSGKPCIPNKGNSKHCIYKPDPNQNIISSLMTSYAYLTMVEEFCDPNTTRKHNALAPTRQNDLCKGQSVWEVIKKHADFSSVSFDNMPSFPLEKNVTPEFTVVREAEANYALVLDYSGSMDTNNRFLRLQNTAQRWILHEVAAGSSVAIVPFADYATIAAQLTEITDDTSRQTLANKITKSFSGFTCIGCGLKKAIDEVLVGKENKVIILISDGEENRNPKINEVMDQVVASAVRVFRPSAEATMENLAINTGGKSYIVNDNDDGSQADAAFEGALTYQPANTITNVNIQVTRVDLVCKTRDYNCKVLMCQKSSTATISNPVRIPKQR